MISTLGDSVKPPFRRGRQLKTKILIIIFISLSVGFALSQATQLFEANGNRVSPRTVTDYLHAVIEADRSFYTQEVVERMESMLIVSASEEWRKDHQLPLPAQFILESSQGLQVSGKPFHYRLLSPWPINARNIPLTDADRQALTRVVEKGEVVENQIRKNDTLYFQAIYPDRAISRACVNCHNSHNQSPKRDFRLNDVMGGLEILIPLE